MSQYSIGLTKKDTFKVAYMNLLNVYQSLGIYHEALDYYEKALKIVMDMQNCSDYPRDTGVSYAARKGLLSGYVHYCAT